MQLVWSHDELSSKHTPHSCLTDAKFLAGGWASQKNLLNFTSSEVLGRPQLFLLHKQPVFSNHLYHRRMFLALRAAIPKRRWSIRCIKIMDSLLLKCRTQKDFCCAVIIMSGIKKNLKQSWCTIMTSQRFACL